MATNEQEQPPQPKPLDQMMEKMGLGVAKITDTGPLINPNGGLTLRVWFLIVGIGAILSVSTPPLNVIGVVLLVALAITLANRSVRRAP